LTLIVGVAIGITQCDPKYAMSPDTRAKALQLGGSALIRAGTGVIKQSAVRCNRLRMTLQQWWNAPVSGDCVGQKSRRTTPRDHGTTDFVFTTP